MREIILPPHLYDRIKASAGEHGGIGAGALFDGFDAAHPTTENLASGMPLCVHGHAWGTCTRYAREKHIEYTPLGLNPELRPFLGTDENDSAICAAGFSQGERVPFERWCELLNVRRGVEVTAQEPELVSVA